MKKKLQLLLLLFVSGFFTNSFAQNLTEDYSYSPSGKPLEADTEALLKGDASVLDSIETEKCATVEMTEALRKKYPYLGTDEEFEIWIAEKIKENKERALTERNPGGIYRMPIVVHVIHDNEPVNTVGNNSGANISTAQIMSQIESLNRDFRMQNSDRANNPEWDSVAADFELEFVPALRHPDTGLPLAEPGINRVNRNDLGLPAPPYSTTVMDNVVKPATSWNWEKVINIWVAPISPAGLYGYAQFPSQSGLDGMPANGGAADTDGVVCNTGTFGRVVDNDGSFNIWNDSHGRTLTHELGHWVGLRHIWGDGPCSQDDFVEDTPRMPSSSPFGSCVAGQNTCDDTLFGAPVDLKDMNANYMDYSADTCMNLFTQGQKDRLEAVLENSPGRGGLIYSDIIAPADAEVTFINTTASSFEGSGLSVQDACSGYKDVNVQLYLKGNATGGEPKVSIELDPSSTATEGVDFEILNESLDFVYDGGLADSKVVTLRIYDEAISESDETIILNAVNFDANGSDAIITQKVFTYTITNDDIEPTPANTPKFLVLEDFENGMPDGLTTIATGENANNFVVGDVPPLTNNSFYASSNGEAFAYSPVVVSNYTLFPLNSFDGAESASLTFDWSGVGYILDFFGFVFPLDYGTVGFINEEQTSAFRISENLANNDDSLTTTIDIPEQFLTGNWYFYVNWRNLNLPSASTSIAFDNIKLKTNASVEFETTLTGNSPSYVNIPGGSTVHVYSKEALGKELIATIENKSSHDYGCTKVEIDRVGAAAEFYKNSCPDEKAFGKTILITPENESEQDLDVTIYFTTEEKRDWAKATGLKASNLYLAHSNGAIKDETDPVNNSQIKLATATDFNNYGTGYKASFSGNLGGGYALVPASSMAITNVKAVQDQEEIKITFDQIFPLSDIKYFALEKSIDNVNWTELKVLENTGIGSYTVVDNFPANGGNLYRVRPVAGACDILSEEAYINFEETNTTKVYPNPAIDQVTLLISNSNIKGATAIGFFDEKGSLVMEEAVNIPSNNGVFRQTYNISNLGAGQYFIKAIGRDGEVIASFVKVENK